MRPADVVYRPRAGYWGLCLFYTLVFAASSFFWFFEPTILPVKILGGLVVVLWLSVLVGLARSRVELHESAVEIYGFPYQTPRVQPWLYIVLILFVVWDLAVLFLGTPPLLARRLHLNIRGGLVITYLVSSMQAMERGRRSLAYADLTDHPTERKWGPVKRVLTVTVEGRTRPFMFPAWLNAADRRDLAGRIAARRRMALGLHEATEPGPGVAAHSVPDG